MDHRRAEQSDETDVRPEDEAWNWQASQARADSKQTARATAAISELSTLALLCQCSQRGDCEPILKKMLGEMHVLMAALNAGNLGGVNPLVSALNSLIRDLYKAPNQVNPPPLRTITEALDFLRVSVWSRSYLDELERAPLKVLLVDDDPVCRSALAASLRVTALAPTVCGSAQEAFEVLRNDRFDVIFTDILMPEMDGFEFFRQVRTLPNCLDTPVIFVTCLTDAATRSRSELAGARELMTKPWMHSEIRLNAFTFGLKHRVAAAKNQTVRQEALAPIGVACPAEQGKVEANHRIVPFRVDL